MRFSRYFCVAIALCLGACSDNGGEALLTDYEARLSRTLGLDFSATDLAEPPRKPRAEALQLKLQSSDIGTLDFLALTGCELQITIGKRNSSLGKLAAPSQRLLLDLEFLRHAPACIAHLESKGDQQALVALLEQSQELKQQQLGQQIFNATLAGPEWHAFWKPRALPAGYPKATTSDQVLQALDAITHMASRWLAGDYTADNQAFEANLNALRAGDGGVIITANQMAQTFITRWNRDLTQKAQQPACRSLNTTKKTILETVVAKYFAGGVQQWLAPIISRTDSIQASSLTLEQLLSDVSPDAYQRWQRQRSEHLGSVKPSVVTHVHALQNIMRNCEPKA